MGPANKIGRNNGLKMMCEVIEKKEVRNGT